MRFAKANRDLNMAEYHLDHSKIPFLHIVQNSMKENNLTYEDLQVVYIKDRPQLKDKLLAKSFYSFHKKVAEYKIIPATENMKKGNK